MCGVNLYDNLLRGRVTPFDPSLPPLHPDIVSDITPAVRIEIDNVTNYYFEASPKDQWSLQDSFVNMAPSFECAIWTTRAPRYSNVNGEHKQWESNLAGSAWAWLQRVSIVEDGDEGRSFWSEMTANSGDTPEHARTISGEVAWLSMFELFMQAPERGSIGPCCVVFAAVGPDGAICRDENGHDATAVAVGSRNTDFQEFFRHSVIQSYLFPVVLAQSFLHCKNVSLQEGMISRQQRRAAERRGEPTQRFYTIQIDPMKQVLRAEGQIEKVGLNRALHICRGHFQTYTEEKPMFGKYAGTFWVPAHVRGTEDAGKVFKDYAIKT